MVKRYGFHFVSLVAVVVFMIVGYSPMLSVFYSTMLAFVMSALAPETSFGAAQAADPDAGDRHHRRRRCSTIPADRCIGVLGGLQFLLPAAGAADDRRVLPSSA